MRRIITCILAGAVVALVVAALADASWPSSKGTVVRSPRTPSISNGSSPPLTWIRAGSRYFLNRGDKRLILRGFVTTPIAQGIGGVQYTRSSYARLRSLGANYQSIRVTIGALGYGHGGIAASGYLRELSQMVNWAAQQGIYSEFKVTVYGVPNFDWTSFWRDGAGEQKAYIDASATLWRRFVGDPAVLGYDLLNEPSPGALQLSPTQFESEYLNPFYREDTAALRGLDHRHVVLFQPPVVPGSGPLPYTAPLRESGLAYAPHFYPPHPNFTTGDYLPLLERFLSESRRSDVPLMIGEYGTPWDANHSRAVTTLKLERLEQAYYRLFQRFGLSYSRPWYANDSVSARTSTGQQVTWSLVASQHGLVGPLRQWIAVPFADAAEHGLRSHR